MKRLVLGALAVLSSAVIGITAAPAGAQTATFDYGDCAFGTGAATVPTGESITLTDTGSFA